MGMMKKWTDFYMLLCYGEIISFPSSYFSKSYAR